MDLTACSRVIVYGGSFDPPHTAHVALPLMAAQALGTQAVLYIPAGKAPHKKEREQTPAHHRLAMLRLAVAHIPNAFVLTDEIDRASALGKPSFTVDTLEALRQRLGQRVEMRLLIGADMARIFQQWRSPERIVQLAEPVVMLRPPETAESLFASLPVDQRDAWKSRLIIVPQMDVSSSDIRARVSRGEPITGLTPPVVVDYIRRHGLYR
ncbi:MAG: nicotinate (nicotinamide) nucleotide adenylyltransferase [Planctomycetes bacterium]|nr:nicotinate (nicotinamide) nucleotide adenylyltransferase [Planctomycetota bacterium]